MWLYTGCCVCQLCGHNNCPDGLGCVTHRGRAYEVCTACFNDDSVWYRDDGSLRAVPRKPTNRVGDNKEKDRE